jgi:glutathionylspermidine synthase
VNHIPNITIIASKSKLIQTTREYENKNKGLAFSSKDFFPETYRIDLTQEVVSTEEDNFIKRNNDGIWIVKPTFANCGIGIKICTNTKRIKTEILRYEWGVTNLIDSNSLLH